MRHHHHPEQRTSARRCTCRPPAARRSRLLITSRICASQRSLSVIRLWRQKRSMNVNRKNRNITTPMNGCRMRVQGPPPNRLVRKKNDGWKNASPDSAGEHEADRDDPVVDALPGRCSAGSGRLSSALLFLVVLDLLRARPSRSGRSRRAPRGPVTALAIGLATPFHSRHHRAHLGILRQALELRLVGVLQHVHDVRAAHALRVVQARVLEAALLAARRRASRRRPSCPPWCRRRWRRSGQIFTQAGSRPTATRSEHSVHL